MMVDQIRVQVQLSTSREGEFSGTNNQGEAGVDEGFDFLKTDGFHIYMLNSQSLVVWTCHEIW